MNINYHYFTIKTLAHHAGLPEDAAQRIAHFSQQVDNFIMDCPFLVENEPPEFFLRNGLAHPCETGKWVFSPCPTGINFLNSVSHSFQEHTLMPFHFLMAKPSYTVPKDADRAIYRCVSAQENDSLLIHDLVNETFCEMRAEDSGWQTKLGMLLHTYADTYAHCNFSGFHGWENESYVKKMDHKQADAPFVFSGIFKWLNDTWVARMLKRPSPLVAMSPMEIGMYRKVPSIGHGNVNHAPDYCDCDITLYAKKDRDGALEPLIDRDNTAFFEECSKNIFAMLCKAADKPDPDSAVWDALVQRIRRVHTLREQSNEKRLTKLWSAEFPEVTYRYRKDEFIKLKVELVEKDQKLLNHLNCSESAITDTYSEQGEQARAGCLMIASEINDEFYRFAELAYRRVYAATGEYASQGSVSQLSDYRKVATQYYV